MSFATGIGKTLVWVTRLLQWLLAIILMGICAWMIDQYRDGHFRVLPEVILPEVASVLAVVFTAFSIFTIFFMGYTMQLVACFLDFVIFVLYLASAGLLRHNFHAHRQYNPLWWSLMDVRRAQGETRHPNMTSGLVKLLVALTVIQIILFFFTTILGFMVASGHPDRTGRRTRHAV
ncbi:hypothetical protein FPQ18DRAFT_314340 [Pyronema domesticum]|uniref:MARVEL domain-containing protein n=1 Tax=Pyronema omphalodes (strain CBS 100304) TaxID=1076935 RepID=U4LVU9_PYROM|nr:hypothetical protein FPQ18DRAFT_314340 [Pyronema domesticum]CCX34892.1 Similar to hypothetical protein [Tuber melanosporum Mel28]; acc. no. XP_002838569 [Pyronema omphalodes CBS 100304]